MWSIWGTNLNIWLSEEGKVTIGGDAIGHECRPTTGLDGLDVHRFSALGKLPLSWVLTPDSSGDLRNSLSDQVAIRPSFRRPIDAVSIIAPYEDMVGLICSLPDDSFNFVYDGFRTLMTSRNPAYYLLHVGDFNFRSPLSESMIPTSEDFLVHHHPFVGDERVSVTFRYGVEIPGLQA